MQTRNSLFSRHISLHDVAAFPGWEKRSNAATVCNKFGRSAMTSKRLAFLDKGGRVRWQLTATRALPILKKKMDQPALHDFEDIVLDIVLHVLRRLQRSAVCPKSTISLRIIGSIFVRKKKSSPCGPYLLGMFQPLAVVRIPTTSQGSREGHILSQQGTSQTVCRLFIFTLLTSIKPRARAKTAKTCKPIFTSHLL